AGPGGPGPGPGPGGVSSSMRLTLQMTFPDAASARRAAPVLREGIRTVTGKLQAWTAEVREHDREFGAAVAPLMEAVAAGLTKATVLPPNAGTPTVLATADVAAGPAAPPPVGALRRAIGVRTEEG